ncbi:MAG: hypothetical protein E4G98_02530 [Promethearchaeota archaeon]|nr:MAG: hypothetical protein E4G98_02530 [Candidatus Lokiarchaeota archaeon]
MTVSSPICFYNGTGPGYQYAILSEYQKAGGTYYEKPNFLYVQWMKQGKKNDICLIEVGKDFALGIIHAHHLPIDLESFQARIYDILDHYTFAVFLLQCFPQIPEDHFLHTFMLTSTVEDGCSWIPTRTAADTALCVRSLAKRIQIADHPPSMGRVTPKWKTLDQAQKELIAGLTLTGTKKANILMDHFNSPWDLFSRLQQGDLVDIKGFGQEFTKQNRELLLKKMEIAE